MKVGKGKQEANMDNVTNVMVDKVIDEISRLIVWAEEDREYSVDNGTILQAKCEEARVNKLKKAKKIIEDCYRE